MTFEKLHADTPNCNCIGVEDFYNVYVRLLESDDLHDREFISYWEKNPKKYSELSRTCEDVCSYKGISISLWNNDSKEKTIHEFKRISGIARKLKFVLFFKLLPNSGQVKHTPNEENFYHHDILKSDSFSSQLCLNIKIIPIDEFLKL